mmetsp:Transcript_16113/g.34054  ORF Transcript_16113/g.34054 Transcript_16113/m.34054 type:complete len:99 (-) Transcript_16113:103-399(-)
MLVYIPGGELCRVPLIGGNILGSGARRRRSKGGVKVQQCNSVVHRHDPTTTKPPRHIKIKYQRRSKLMRSRHSDATFQWSLCCLLLLAALPSHFHKYD